MAAACQQMMPLFFLSHGGGPCFFMNADNSLFMEMDKNSRGANFYKNFRATQLSGISPAAIVVISAHWEEKNIAVGYQAKGTSLIYDYYGFPKETYSPHLTYNCPTDLVVADRVAQLLQDANIPCNKVDRGFDHGVFIPLKLAFPEADVPVIQLSLNGNLDPLTHITIGEALSPLRNEGVVIIGSGQTTHNLGDFGSSGSNPKPYTVEFTEWLRTTLEGATSTDSAASRQALINIENAPHLRKIHPRTEHLIPLHVVFGAAFPRNNSLIGPVSECKRIFQQIVIGTMSLDSYKFA